MRQLSSIVIILSLVVSMSACSIPKRPTLKYGSEYNEVRMQVGLPTIGEDWEIGSVHLNEATLVLPGRQEKYEENIPIHWSKYLNYRTGTLISETDTYYGSEDYQIPGEGTFREKLTIAFFYQKDDYVYKSKFGWDIHLYNQETSAGGKELSLEEAEKILEEWGIERLDYEFPP